MPPKKNESHARQELVAELDAAKRELKAARRELDAARRELDENKRELEDLSLMFQMSLEPLCVANIETASFIKVNPAFTRVLGFSQEELAGRPFSDFIHPDDQQATDEIVARHLRAGEDAINFQNRYRCKNGSYKWLNWVSHPAPLEGRVYAVARDITETRKTEEALRESEAKYSSLYNSMIEGVALHELILGPNGTPVDYRIMDVNPRYEATLGICRSQAVGKKASELYGGGDIPYLEKYASVARGGNPLSFDTYYQPLEKHFRISVFSPKPNWFATVFEDITERVLAHKELERSLRELSDTKALLDAVMAQSPVPMVIASAPDMILRIANHACRDILGIEDEESQVGKHLITGMKQTWKNYNANGEPIATDKMPLALALKGESVHGMELRVVRQDGTERWAVVYGAPIYNDQGELIAGFISFPDITDLKRAEQLMVQTEKMITVGGLAAGMAHEINNPLGIILQSVQNIERRLSPEIPGNAAAAEQHGLDMAAMDAYLEERNIKEYIQGIRQAGERAAAIVRNMLNFSRRSESVKTDHSIHKLLDKVIELIENDYDLKKKYDFRKTEVVRDYAPGLPNIPITETEIEQVFVNLLKNAAQAITGNTSGATPRILLRTADDGDFVRVEVMDNGPGMTKKQSLRAFEPFYTTKAPGQGTGLGLSVSYFIITRNHGGTIEADSAPDKGARFIVRLPKK